jgi:hypothetical protein
MKMQLWWSVAAATGWAMAQDPAPTAPPVVAKPDEAAVWITEARVRDTVGWLAADERAGRATGSREAAAVADWLAARFAAAGLQKPPGGSGDGFRHQFTMTGFALDSAQVELKLRRTAGDKSQEVTLTANTEVRQWRVADACTGSGSCLVATWDDAVLQRLLTANAARQPIVIEIDEQSTAWQEAAGLHTVLQLQRAAARPVFLVKKGVLPVGEGRDPDWSADWKVGVAEKVDVPQANVMALWPGTGKKDEIVLVSAHYDHLGLGDAVGGDSIYNGADDNATGTTAVVLLAEALAKGPPLARSVLFVAFTAEERGLRGSAAFCEQPPVPLAKIVCNLNLEMLGRPLDGKHGAAWITGVDYSNLAAIAKAPLASAGVELVDFPQAKMLFRASDNWSFVQRGVVAHSLSAGSLHKDYHQPDDEADRLDIPHMTTVIRGLSALVQQLANADATPQWNEQGRKVSGRLAR